MTIKISIWQGYKHYNLQNYRESIKYFETAVLLYPKKIGKIHLKLAEMHLTNSNKNKALEHALIAKEINPEQLDKIQLKKNKGYIFDEHNIDEQIKKSLRKKVWLKSGGHLVIEHTEAMVVVDVNSGRFIGKKDHEQNSLKINLEAAREVAHQLRLRDIGGLIVIDFIDLQKETNRKKVLSEFKKHLKKDRAKVSISGFSDFGLLEMTRQRIRLDLIHTYKEECTTCNGSGLILSKESMLIKIETWIKRFRTKFSDKRLIIYLHPEEANYILKEKKEFIKSCSTTG